jgi:site-specific DNA-methyltransferase (adenine-specific)
MSGPLFGAAQISPFGWPFRVDHLDAAALLAQVPDESIDLVLVDPAYPSLEKHRAVGTTTRLKDSDASSNAWFEVMSWEDLRRMLRAMFRALRPERHAYVLCDDETACWMRREAWAAGFYVWPSLTWAKTAPGSGGSRLKIGMGYHYRQASERIVFLEKRSGKRPKNAGDGVEAVPLPWGGGRQLANLAIPNVLQVDVAAGSALYPTEKPVELLEVLIRQSTEPGELVLDPCCGSGSAGEAAMIAGRRVWLGDRSDVAVARAHLRVEAAHERGPRASWPARFAPREGE